MKKEPQNPSERLTREQWQDHITNTETDYEFYEQVVQAWTGDRDFGYELLQLEFKALQLFHEQEMKFMQEEIPKWISVEDGMPKVHERVLCIGQSGTYCIDYWSNESWAMGLFQSEGNFKLSHTHWMPLPQPSLTTK